MLAPAAGESKDVNSSRRRIPDADIHQPSSLPPPSPVPVRANGRTRLIMICRGDWLHHLALACSVEARLLRLAARPAGRPLEVNDTRINAEESRLRAPPPRDR